MLNFGIVFISSAAVLYTISIFTEKIKKRLSKIIVGMFGTAFCCDLLGTSIMFYIAVKKFSLAPHSVCGYMALLIMATHFFWAIKALKKPEKYEHKFTKFSIYAWIIWVFAFCSGIPKM
jgi:uncharacterized repeat protein (TIGR03987 family)